MTYFSFRMFDKIVLGTLLWAVLVLAGLFYLNALDDGYGMESIRGTSVTMLFGAIDILDHIHYVQACVLVAFIVSFWSIKVNITSDANYTHLLNNDEKLKNEDRFIILKNMASNFKISILSSVPLLLVTLSTLTIGVDYHEGFMMGLGSIIVEHQYFIALQLVLVLYIILYMYLFERTRQRINETIFDLGLEHKDKYVISLD